MTLTAKDVAEITRLLEQSNFDELYLELDGVKLSLRRGAGAMPSARSSAVQGQAPPPAPPGPSSSAPPARGAPAHTSSDAPARAATAGSASNHDIPAPLLGTFYRAPKPGAPAFVEVGSSVDEETIIGIIEVMKLMNTVRAGTRGRIAEILASDGALVEYGEALMRLEPTS